MLRENAPVTKVKGECLLYLVCRKNIIYQTSKIVNKKTVGTPAAKK